MRRKPVCDLSARRRKLALLSGIALALTVMMVTAAMAYTHGWSCSVSSAKICVDNVGQNYNSWERVDAGTEYAPELCAKARTQEQNTRSGSGCNYGASFRSSNILGGYPASAAYVYWGGSGGARIINGFASTND